jgi:hypothetical protein
MKYLLYIGLLMLLAIKLPAQQEVFKVTKHLERTFSSNVKSVEVSGEKALITIEGWTNDFTKIEVKSISRNQVKKIAEADLRCIKTEMSQTSAIVTAKNYFEGKSSLITSNLSVEYHIKVPANVSLVIHNLYGKVVAQHLGNKLSLTISFSSVDINSITGATDIQAKYSEITGAVIKGLFSCNTEKTDIKLIGVNAPTHIVSKYGEVSLTLVSNQHGVSVNSQRAKVSVILPNQPFNFDLKNRFSEIILPGQAAVKTDIYEKRVDEKAATINITTSYCPIIISKENKP